MTITPSLHPHLVRIRRMIDENDAVAQSEGATVEKLHDSLVDYDSAYIAAEERAVQILYETPPMVMLLHPRATVAATWTDGFLAGVRFAKDSQT